ncbi:hypothetical protein EON64_08870 [archaeon]|nr:MAG: hypothetical protein EON64_08870 [archaeon]
MGVSPPVALGIKPSAPQFLDPPSRCAQLLHMSREDFLSLAPLPPPEEGGHLPYAELLRRNLSKDYEGGIRGGELETYLSDADFLKVFQKTKVPICVYTVMCIV